MEKKKVELDRPIQPGIYPVIDNDLARDNIENDIPAADLEDLKTAQVQTDNARFY